ncbi:hypothetical protein [Jannaschia sp. CCS1]|uniref:hypothetical protein n=1 Tax=Jannaschia sp. (strain CCS1) TaxID=290400 RepID=UPI000053CF7A|nr:hypothetical protein [Jannaschia sp. CCS1]ABD57178.1 hypothetical protein Jann_4262 [Jannaschia sp. CCS1]
MTRIKFKGFTDGETVSIAASDGTSTLGPVTVSAWRQTQVSNDFGNMTININSAFIDNPNTALLEHIGPLTFTATVNSDTGLPVRANRDVGSATYDVYDQQFHELDFVWSMGDAGTFDLVSRLPSFMRSRNTAHGKYVSHVYDTPGAKTVTCSAYRTDFSDGSQSSVLVARKTVTFTVADQDVCFPGNMTVCIDPDANYIGAPAGAQTFPTFWDFVENGVNNGFQGGEGSLRFLYRRGKTHQIDQINAWGQYRISNTSTHIWGGFGDGPRPVLTASAIGNIGNGPMLRFSPAADVAGQKVASGLCLMEDLEIKADWDTVTNTGQRYVLFAVSGPGRFAFAGCKLHSCETAITSNVGDADQVSAPHGPYNAITFFDTEVTDCREYAVILASHPQHVYYRGTGFYHHENHFSNMDPAAEGVNGRGQLRHTPMGRVVIVQSDMFSRAGNTTPAQPVIRLNVSPTTQDGGFEPDCLVWGNIIEGGERPISLGIAGKPGGDPGAPYNLYPMNTVIKHNIMPGAWTSEKLLEIARGCISVVENYCPIPDANTVGAFDATTQGVRSAPYDVSISADLKAGTTRGEAIVSSAYSEPFRIFGNMIVDLRSTSNANQQTDGFEDPSAWATGLVEFRDNSIYAPNWGAANTVAGPFTNVGDITPRMTRGPIIDVGRDGTYEDYPDFATPFDGLPLLRPDTGAGVDETATGPLSRTDLLGNVRDTNATAGPVEAG